MSNSKTPKTTYKLYAMSTSVVSMKVADRERFSRVTPGYTLIYTNRRKPDGAILIEKDDLRRLSDSDSKWLADCNIALILEKTAENEPVIVKRMAEIVDRFEEELGKEADSNVSNGG